MSWLRGLLRFLFGRGPYECESCGGPADVVIRDGSTWCFRCHTGALDLGYDRQGGRLL